MYSVEISVNNATGLHARPAAQLVGKAQKFSSKLIIHHNGKQADIKSIISVLAAGIKSGSVVTLDAEGSDEVEAANAIKELIESFTD